MQRLKMLVCVCVCVRCHSATQLDLQLQIDLHTWQNESNAYGACTTNCELCGCRQKNQNIIRSCKDGNNGVKIIQLCCAFNSKVCCTEHQHRPTHLLHTPPHHIGMYATVQMVYDTSSACMYEQSSSISVPAQRARAHPLNMNTSSKAMQPSVSVNNPMHAAPDKPDVLFSKGSKRPGLNEPAHWELL